MWQLVNRLRKFLAGPNAGGSEKPFSELNRRFLICQIAVRAIYVYAFLSCMRNFARATSLDLAQPINPPSIAFWFHYLPMETVSAYVFGAYLLGLLGVLWSPDYRWARFLVAFGCLYSYAFEYSYRVVSHANLGVIWVVLVLMFLPKIRNENNPSLFARLTYLKVCWTSLAFLLTGYTLSGFWKVIQGVFYALASGGRTWFSMDSQAYLLASFLGQIGSEPPAAAFFIEHQFLGWLSMMAVIYAEFFAFLVPFRPKLMFPWALFLAAFHFMTIAAMNIPFTIFAVMALFALTVMPFGVKPRTLRDFILNLPPVPTAVYLWCRFKKKI